MALTGTPPLETSDYPWGGQPPGQPPPPPTQISFNWSRHLGGQNNLFCTSPVLGAIKSWVLKSETDVSLGTSQRAHCYNQSKYEVALVEVATGNNVAMSPYTLATSFDPAYQTVTGGPNTNYVYTITNQDVANPNNPLPLDNAGNPKKFARIWYRNLFGGNGTTTGRYYFKLFSGECDHQPVAIGLDPCMNHPTQNPSWPLIFTANQPNAPHMCSGQTPDHYVLDPPGGCQPGWFCFGDYHCREIASSNQNVVYPQISPSQVVADTVNMASNIWLAGSNFGYTLSRIQSPPNGNTWIEPYQGVDLTQPGQPLHGVGPNITTLTQLVSIVLPGVGLQLPGMPANPVSNPWLNGIPPYSPNNHSPGGATIYREVGLQTIWNWVPPNPPTQPQGYFQNTSSNTQMLNWNPLTGQTPGPGMTGGMTLYRGVLEPPANAPAGTPAMTNPVGAYWNPFHLRLSDCVSCCGCVHTQFDENGAINPYYGPYMLPPGWNDPQNPVPSQNQDFNAFLAGANPFNVALPPNQYALDAYRIHKGVNMCGFSWIGD